MDNIANEARQLLQGNDGHGFDHIERVRDMALTFARQENADLEIIELACLLHDVDDYKLFGADNAKNLTNAHRILSSYTTEEDKKYRVLEIISNMGYNKSLEGIRPTTIEGMIVSDADMCDAIGSEGILRTHAYGMSKGGTFFNKDLAPRSNEMLSASRYRKSDTSHSVQHFFDKLLKIPDLLLTQSGRAEGGRRQKIMVDFLEELFREHHATDWQSHLDAFMQSTAQ